MKTCLKTLRFLGILFVVLGSQSALAQSFITDRWNEGFLEKRYTISEGELNAALNAIFVKCVAVSIGDDGAITWGVGDKSNRWGGWKGVSTIKELDVKDGGVNISVRKTLVGKSYLTNKIPISVGFKVGDGDIMASEILHKLLADKLREDTSKTSQ